MKKQILSLVLMLGISTTAVVANETPQISDLITLAQKEGTINSVGMPDSWANWKDTWVQLEDIYQLKHRDTDMSSAQEISTFASEKYNASADIGDVGISFGPIAVKRGVTQPYKTSYWEQIPEWAKDDDGHWIVAYTGTIAFIINKDLVSNPPSSWEDLLHGDYIVTIGDMLTGAQSINALLAASYAYGGDEKNIDPGINFFKKLAEQKRLSLSDVKIAELEKEEIAVGIIWDFNGLNYRDIVDKDKFEVLIPSDGSVMSGYATIINKYAQNPNAAKLTREYILSDQGQVNLALGYARPIRAQFIDLPQEAQDRLLPESQYKNIYTIKDFDQWHETTKNIPTIWQEKITSEMY